MRVKVDSVFGAFEYVISHYYPAGMEEFADLRDTYAVISIQDTHTEGFGLEFRKNRFCKDVLTLRFDDIEDEVEGAVLFSDEQADQIIRFVKKNKDVDTLLIHCYAGKSRSWAVGAFARQMLGKDNSRYFTEGSPNMHVYHTLEAAWVRSIFDKTAIR